MGEEWLTQGRTHGIMGFFVPAVWSGRGRGGGGDRQQDAPPRQPRQLPAETLLPLKGDQGSATVAAASAAAAAPGLPATCL